MAKYYPAFYMTEGVVGERERNEASDVKLIQSLFVGIIQYAPNTWQGLARLSVDGQFSALLGDYIRRFQQGGYGPNRLVVDGKIHPMRMTQGDLRSTFRSGVGSTLYWLNVASMANARLSHGTIGTTLNLNAITDV